MTSIWKEIIWVSYVFFYNMDFYIPAMLLQYNNMNEKKV